MDQEIRVLPHDERYGASADGRIWSRARKKDWRELKPCKTPRGYTKVKLGQFDTYAVHILVASVFLGERPAGMTINHINGNKADASAANLEYVSQAENNRHAWRTGLQRSGWPVRRERASDSFGPNGSYRAAA